MPVLREDPSLAFGDADASAVLIEGDNFHALMALTYTHHRHFDVIYIDPPYNTGEGDFIYNDRRVSSEDEFRHSKWLSFMAPRLALAWDLLNKDGVIFISIDDNEQAALRLLCDEIFGANHFLGNLTWINRTQPINSGKAKVQIQQNVEYILTYSKRRAEQFPGFRLAKKSEKQYPHEGRFGPCRLETIVKSDNGRMKRETMKYEIAGVVPGPGKRWQIGEETARDLEARGRIEIDDKGVPKKAVYPEDEADNSVSFLPFWSHLNDLTREDVKTVIQQVLAEEPVEARVAERLRTLDGAFHDAKSGVRTAQVGKAELADVLGDEHGFDTVKPLSLVRGLMGHFANDVRVLDFFAGSGTTAHAIAQMNAVDGGSRRVVLVTNNEGGEGDPAQGIARRICHERLRRLSEGYTNSKGHSVPGFGFALRYLRAQPTVERRGSHDAMKRAFRLYCGDLLKLRENTFVPIHEERDFALYASSEQLTAVLYRRSAGTQLLTAIEAVGDARPVSLYAFSLDDDLSGGEFVAALGERVRLSGVPKELLETYLAMFQRRLYGAWKERA